MRVPLAKASTDGSGLVEGTAVRARDLKRGDRVVAWGWESFETAPTQWDWDMAQSRSFPIGQLPLVVYDRVNDSVLVRKPDESIGILCRDTSAMWYVVIPVAAPPSSGRVIPDFPHSCPLCGGPAYIGLFRIDHQSGACRPQED